MATRKKEKVYKRMFNVDDEVIVGRRPVGKSTEERHERAGILGVVTGYFEGSLSHCYVETDLSGTRLIVPQEELELVPACPYRVVIRVLVGKRPPFWFKGNPANLSDENHYELQRWICANLQESMAWSTGIGVIDAACSLVKEAWSNGNFSEDVTATIGAGMPSPPAEIGTEGQGEAAEA